MSCWQQFHFCNNSIVELRVCPSAVVGAVHVTWNMLTPGQLEILIWIVGQRRNLGYSLSSNQHIEVQVDREVDDIWYLTWAAHLGKGRLQSSPPLSSRALSWDSLPCFWESLFSYGFFLESWVFDSMNSTSPQFYFLCSLQLEFEESQSFQHYPSHQSLPHLAFCCP